MISGFWAYAGDGAEADRSSADSSCWGYNPNTMAPMLYRVLYCCHSAKPMQLPLDALQSLFADPKCRPNDVYEIGVLCPRCKRVSKHSIGGAARANTNLETAILEAPDANKAIVCEIDLKCQEPTCRSLLPLVRQRNLSTNEKSWIEFLKTWNFEGLTCPKGHRILKPKDW